jgi:hypothetical protein
LDVTRLKLSDGDFESVRACRYVLELHDRGEAHGDRRSEGGVGSASGGCALARRARPAQRPGRALQGITSASAPVLLQSPERTPPCPRHAWGNVREPARRARACGCGGARSHPEGRSIPELGEMGHRGRGREPPPRRNGALLAGAEVPFGQGLTGRGSSMAGPDVACQAACPALQPDDHAHWKL